MSKDVIRLTIPDVSGFAKQLRRALSVERRTDPSHVEMLNIVARAAGFRNFQHLSRQTPPTPVIDARRVARAARCFDARGRWEVWPHKRSVRALCLWVIWARLPAREGWDERQISAILDELTVFRDAAQIRRSLVEMKLLTRNPDGSDYARVETPMDPEGAALLRDLNARQKTQAPSGKS
ncbi:DUF2087 domain-containing protein [Tritonibacter horizontis]|uniref:DUF2087 domain-containing protein n=1 Tax=Tritonibacter horizontis TaxID=1768241 RepID=A0A132BR70_9RHOB|nr:DUF2087 domain-containing protein [Tritonibacter horizontis]KUP90895.1 hypothetical protein TRIHO_42510 [Tritonibacter horizontis]